MGAPEVIANLQRLIDTLLRYVVAGGTGLVAFGLLQMQPFQVIRTGSDVSPWLALLIIFTIGPAIYSVHKAVLHPFILYFVHLGVRAVGRSRSTQAASLSARQIDIRLTNSLNEWKKSLDPWVPYYEAWAAQVHFLYCSAWGIGGALALTKRVAPATANVDVVCALFFLLLASAVVSDSRLTYRQFEKAFAAG